MDHLTEKAVFRFERMSVDVPGVGQMRPDRLFSRNDLGIARQGR